MTNQLSRILAQAHFFNVFGERLEGVEEVSGLNIVQYVFPGNGIEALTPE